MPTKLPVVLCLHGFGTNAAIFKLQTRHVRAALESEVRFVFVDGPFDAPPGPGVLPCFADCGPFFSWFSSWRNASIEQSAADHLAILQAINDCLAKHNLTCDDINGVLGFSQGALAASLISILRQNRFTTWQSLRVAILLCGAYHDVRPLITQGKRLDIPSIHVHGLRDPLLPSSRLLYSQIFSKEAAIMIEMDIDHTLPHERSDIVEMARHVRNAMVVS